MRLRLGRGYQDAYCMGKKQAIFEAWTGAGRFVNVAVEVAMQPRFRWRREASVLCLCAALVSCGRLATRIGDINSHPDLYENRTVWVHGTVVTSAKLPGTFSAK